MVDTTARRRSEAQRKLPRRFVKGQRVRLRHSVGNETPSSATLTERGPGQSYLKGRSERWRRTGPLRSDGAWKERANGRVGASAGSLPLHGVLASVRGCQDAIAVRGAPLLLKLCSINLI